MIRQPSERALRRWLATGRPSRIGRLAAVDPKISARLEKLSALTDIEVDALKDLVTPADDFEQRTAAGVQQRVDTYATTAAVFDLLGLGFHVGRAVMGEQLRPADATDYVRDSDSGSTPESDSDSASGSD